MDIRQFEVNLVEKSGPGRTSGGDFKKRDIPILCPGGDTSWAVFRRRTAPSDCFPQGRKGSMEGREVRRMRLVSQLHEFGFHRTQNMDLHVNLYFSTSSHVCLSCLHFLSNYFNVPRR